MKLLQKVACAIEPLDESQLLVLKGGDDTGFETAKNTDNCQFIFEGCTVHIYTGNCTWNCGGSGGGATLYSYTFCK